MQLFEHEDDWGWTIYGHRDRRRILAAINALARRYGVHDDLMGQIDWNLDNIVLERKWATNLRVCDDDEGSYTWDWSDTIAGEPMTVVRLRCRQLTTSLPPLTATSCWPTSSA